MTYEVSYISSLCDEILTQLIRYFALFRNLVFIKHLYILRQRIVTLHYYFITLIITIYFHYSLFNFNILISEMKL